MNEVDRAIYKLQARRAAHAAELAAQGPAGPDSVELAMREHDAIMADARARTDAIIPTGRGPATPAPEPVRPAWDKFVWTLQGDVNHGMNLSALLRLAIRQAGYANVRAALADIEAGR